jgi:hypothetical protein
MIDTHPTPKTDAAIRQHRRIKQGLVATWIHEISARHGTLPAAEEAVESVSVAEPAFQPERERVLA